MQVALNARQINLLHLERSKLRVGGPRALLEPVDNLVKPVNEVPGNAGSQDIPVDGDQANVKGERPEGQEQQRR